MNNRFRLSLVIAMIVGALSVGLTGASASGSPGVPTPPVPAGNSPAIASPGQRPFATNPVGRNETVYVAITPCRILDTRQAGGKMANGSVRTFRVGGTSGFAPQGGKSGGCGIPVSATAVAASIGATNSLGSGYLTAWPANLARPTASNLNYTKGQTIASGGNISMQKNTAASLKIANNGGPTDIFVDVTGYYAQQMQGMIAPDGSIYSGSDRIVSATVLGTGVYRVTFDSDVTNCTPTVTSYSGYVYASAYAFGGNVVTIFTWTLSDTTHLKVPTSLYVYISVSC